MTTTTAAPSSSSTPLTQLYPTSFYSYEKYSGPCLVNVNISLTIPGSTQNTTTVYAATGIDICTADSPLLSNPAQNSSQSSACGFSLVGAGLSYGFTKQCYATPLNASLTGSGSVYTLYNPTTSLIFTTTSTTYQYADGLTLPTQYIAVPGGANLSALIIPSGAGLKAANVPTLVAALGAVSLLLFVGLF